MKRDFGKVQTRWGEQHVVLLYYAHGFLIEIWFELQTWVDHCKQNGVCIFTAISLVWFNHLQSPFLLKRMFCKFPISHSMWCVGSRINCSSNFLKKDPVIEISYILFSKCNYCIGVSSDKTLGIWVTWVILWRRNTVVVSSCEYSFRMGERNGGHNEILKLCVKVGSRNLKKEGEKLNSSYMIYFLFHNSYLKLYILICKYCICSKNLHLHFSCQRSVVKIGCVYQMVPMQLVSMES